MTTILGYEFENPALLEEALVTPSCKMENPDTAHSHKEAETLAAAQLLDHSEEVRVGS